MEDLHLLSSRQLAWRTPVGVKFGKTLAEHSISLVNPTTDVRPKLAHRVAVIEYTT